MKSKKISMIIASSFVAITVVAAIPSITTFADTLAPNAQVQNKEHIKKTAENNNSKNEISQEMAAKATSGLQKVNIFTGKVIKTTPKQKAQELAIIFHGSDNMTYYNGKDLQPHMKQTKFHSKTQEKLYNYLMNPNNRWAAENQAIGLHNGQLDNNCVFFVSSALRNIGVNIPKNIGYTTHLMNELTNLGWERKTDLSTLEAGDICFASTYHTYVFMGWANKAEGIAWIADNQITWFGTNFHPRTQHSEPNVDVSPTTCYYRLPGNVDLGGNNKVVDMPENYNYTVGTVVVNGLHVRKGPSTNDKILASLNYGTRIQILGQEGNWFETIYNGQKAYVWAGSVNGKAPKCKEPYTIVPDKEVIGTGKIDFYEGPYTYVKSGPTWSSNTLGQLNNGTKVSILAQKNGWFEISFNGGTGWVLKDRIDTPLAPPIQYKEIAKGKIDFKEGPYTYVQCGNSWSSDTIGQLNNGTKVVITGEKDGWYRINFKDGSAWVLKNRVNVAPKENVIGTGTIDFYEGPYTYVQNGPTWSSSTIGQLNNGTKVDILARKNGWFEISFNGGKGWVVEDRIDTPLAPPVQYKEIAKGKIDFKEGPYTYVQCGNSWSSDTIGQLNNGTKVVITGEKDGWYRINFKDGSAWVLKNRVNVAPKENVIGTGTIDFYEGPYTYVQNGPTWSSNTIGQLNNGTKVDILARKNGWFEISFNGGKGWVVEDRIDTPLAPPIQYKPIVNGVIDFAGGPYTYVQHNNSWSSDTIGQLNNGTEVVVTGEKDGWYRINFKDGSAWVLKDRVNTAENRTKSAIVHFTGGPVTNIQTKASWGYNFYAGQLANGTKITIIGQSGNWYKIGYNGKIAWIMKDRVRVIK